MPLLMEKSQGCPEITYSAKKLYIPAKVLAQACTLPLPKDFTFQVCGKDFTVNTFFARLLCSTPKQSIIIESTEAFSDSTVIQAFSYLFEVISTGVRASIPAELYPQCNYVLSKLGNTWITALEKGFFLSTNILRNALQYPTPNDFSFFINEDHYRCPIAAACILSQKVARSLNTPNPMTQFTITCPESPPIPYFWSVFEEFSGLISGKFAFITTVNAIAYKEIASQLDCSFLLDVISSMDLSGTERIVSAISPPEFHHFDIPLKPDSLLVIEIQRILLDDMINTEAATLKSQEFLKASGNAVEILLNEFLVATIKRPTSYGAILSVLGELRRLSILPENIMEPLSSLAGRSLWYDCALARLAFDLEKIYKVGLIEKLMYTRMYPLLHLSLTSEKIEPFSSYIEGNFQALQFFNSELSSLLDNGHKLLRTVTEFGYIPIVGTSIYNDDVEALKASIKPSEVNTLLTSSRLLPWDCQLFPYFTFLDASAFFGATKSFQYLMSIGAEPSRRTFRMAICSNHQETISYLYRFGHFYCIFDLLLAIMYSNIRIRDLILQKHYKTTSNLALLNASAQYNCHATLANCLSILDNWCGTFPPKFGSFLLFRDFANFAQNRQETMFLNCLGQCYQFGLGVAQNEDTAFALYSKSAAAEDPLGLVLKGSCLEIGIGASKDTVSARDLYQNATERGSAVGLFLAAELLNSGEARLQSISDSIKDFLVAAMNGAAIALWKLGVITRDGSGVDRNRSMHWYLHTSMEMGFLRAFNFYASVLDNEIYFSDIVPGEASICCKFGASLGDPGSASHFSGMIKRGRELPPDFEEYLRYLAIASRDNNPHAMMEVAISIADRSQDIDELKKARELAFNAARCGKRNLVLSYASFIENGIGGNIDKEKADVLKRVANADCFDAHMHLNTKCIFYGREKAGNEREKAICFAIAAEYDDIDGIIEYAKCLEKGIGVNIDSNAALELCKKALSKHNSERIRHEIAEIESNFIPSFCAAED